MPRAGLMHDIGKLGVSNMILDKPSKPTADEFDADSQHPDYSMRILEQVDAFKTLADVAGRHHERLDGRGYHRRLDGTQLPWIARVLTVADISEAMSARWPYRDRDALVESGDHAGRRRQGSGSRVPRALLSGGKNKAKWSRESKPNWPK